MDGLENLILKTYKELKNIKRVQIKLGLSYYKVHKVLKKHNVNARKKGKRIKHRFYNCIVKWLYYHPGIVLPRSPIEIEKLTGCNKDAVKTFLYRQRRDIKNYVANIQKNNPLKVLGSFKDIHGVKLNYKMVEQFYPLRLDILNGTLLLRLKLKAVNNKYYFVRINIKEFI